MGAQYGDELSQEDQDFLDSFEENLQAVNEGKDIFADDPQATQGQAPTEPSDPVDTGSDPFGSGEPTEPQEPAFEVNTEEAARLYEAVMAQPIKANGKEIQFRDVDEVIRAAQMGLNYTKKMQEMAKYKRTIATLANNGVTTDEDIQFLLDLKNKNPQAIAKYFKDSGVDPYDIDTSAEVDYKPNTEMVSVDTVLANEVLDELRKTPNGSTTMRVLADTWDAESINRLYKNPEGFRLLHEQRESGIFDQVMAEIDRLATLGQLPAGASTLDLYNSVGDQLMQAGNIEQRTGQTQPSVASSPSSTRSDKRAAASSPRSAKRTKSMALEDMLDLDNEAFLKAMQNRL